MEKQKWYGKLYVVATPIGNLEDITLRAIRILKQVDIIAAEDTRHTLKLLNHLGISKPLISYHRHNEEIKTDELINKLEEGVLDPQISDYIYWSEMTPEEIADIALQYKPIEL